MSSSSFRNDSRSVSTVMSETALLGDDFSLEFIAARLADFRIPKGRFDPRGDWQLDYGVYTFTGMKQGPVAGGQVGHLSLGRTAIDEKQAQLTLRYSKNGPGVIQTVDAVIRCRTDALSTPIRWRYSAEVADLQGKPYENSRIAKHAEAADGRIDLVDESGTRRLAMNGPFTINWAVWDAVMRMPRKAGEPIRFTMLDHFDQAKPRQTLAFRKSVGVTLGQRRIQEQSWLDLEKGRIRQTRWAAAGGQPIALHGFEQLGEGIVPWIYWTDDAGRLLFAISGLEVYILDSWQT